MEKGLQQLRELAVLEMVCSDLDNAQTPKDPDEVQCTPSMWCKFVWGAPSSHASTLAAMRWKDVMGSTVYVVSRQLQQYEENLFAPLRACTVAVEKLSQNVHHLKERTSSSSARGRNISAMQNQYFPVRGKEYPRRTPRGTLWFYLHEHGEDMRKWGGEPTSTLAAQVCELQGNMAAKRGSPRKTAALVSVGQSPRGSRRADVTLDPDGETSALHWQELSDRYFN